jgi:prepilin signal peptidase PulO-like enzyme (type II secretory pathway)
MVVTAAQPESRSARRRQSPGRVEFVLAGFVVVGVLVQAALAGRHIGEDASISLHGVLGNVVFGFQVALVAVAVARRATSSALVIAVLILGLLVGQIGLGYAGRDATGAVAWHVLNGVALFGLASVQLARSWPSSGDRC